MTIPPKKEKKRLWKRKICGRVVRLRNFHKVRIEANLPEGKICEGAYPGDFEDCVQS